MPTPIPWLLALPALAGLSFLVLPLLGLLIRAPWSNAWQVITDDEALLALRLSLITATVAMVLAVLLGVPLAWLLARSDLPAMGWLRAVITVPLVLPPVVGGVALFTVLGRSGLLGWPLYQLTGFAFPFTPYAVVLAQTFVALPFLILSVEGALRAADRRYEDAAATLGARPLTIFSRVTLPLIGPGVAAGAVLAWARALGEFGATITFAGNFPGTTRTMPLQVYLALETDPSAALMLSVLLLAVSVLVLVLLRDRWVNRW
ncbi:MAG: Molybdenum ABC transporter permease protein ModB [uncultured Propionibacteriaceae bacterium]|uniref:Molybdenum transport system permease n=1 Tax=uncultured Propionibacteriaceae bacterium TaxID=257457 RepID=A0A6N3ITT2_9ACTN|nr:MAG: Molybdenum ABC transporter permease protein ModB [uncultured Propionibacteriaceae bacterium]